MGEDHDRFEPLFEHANDAIALVEFHDETPMIEDANPVFRELFELEGTDVVGRDLDEVVTSDERAEEARSISRRAQDGQLVRKELTRHTVDGPREFRWQLVPVDDDSDTVERAFAIYADITDRTRERERFRAFIEQSTDIISVLDGNGIYQYQSPSSERLLGYEPSELLGENAFEYLHPEDRQRVMETFFEAVEQPDLNPTAEYRFQHKDGSWLWLESRGNYQLENPAIEGFVINTRNITERKEREQELEAVRDRMEFALNATDAIVWDWNVDRDEASFYPSEETLFGTSVDTWSDFLDLIHPEDREPARAAIERSLETGEPKHEELRIVRDGEVRWLAAPGQPVQEPDGTTRMIGVARDITDRKRSEQELERQNERLDEFAGVVSHDLRNPLNVAQGRLELIREEPEPEHLDIVARAHDRMETLIEDLLTLARAGDSVGEPEPVELSTLVERSWQNVKASAATLRVETDATIVADRTRLQQLLENLLRNAVEHGGGGVTIELGDMPGGFYVEDDGPGISNEDCEAVLRAGYSTSEAGTGFGLSIVREIADAHGWDFEITAGADGGARFEFTGVQRG